MYKLKKHIASLEERIAVLQTVNCNCNSPLKEKLYELEKLQSQYSVHALCDALKINRATFYNHIFRSKKENNYYKFRREFLSKEISQVFHDNNQIFGANKIKAILQ